MAPRKRKQPEHLSRDELRLRLETIVRDGSNDYTVLSAVKQLREMIAEDADDSDAKREDSFAKLDELASRRRTAS